MHRTLSTGSGQGAAQGAMAERGAVSVEVVGNQIKVDGVTLLDKMASALRAGANNDLTGECVGWGCCYDDLSAPYS